MSLQEIALLQIIHFKVNLLAIDVALLRDFWLV
jgi:hypothetical protein